MNESVKSVLGLTFVTCLFGGIIAWCISNDNNVVSTATWVWRIGGPLIGTVCIVLLIWACTRKDKVPDFLSRITPRYFERDGFCFTMVPYVVKGECVMRIYFQNRYDRPCSAQILIRASSGLFSGRPDLSDVVLGVSCGPGEFGCSSIPWRIPAELQGKAVSLSVYAGVKYLNGRGSLLRYKDGIRVGSVGMDAWREGLQIAGAIGGAFVLSRPARVNFTLPYNVSSVKQDNFSVDTNIMWKLGDPITCRQ